MKKQEFLDELRGHLLGLPEQDREESLAFWGEMIDDRMEEGRTEEEAVADIGSVEEISAQIIAEVPLIKIAKETVKPKRRLRWWEILLLVLGAPVWLPLIVAAFAVLFALFVVIGSMLIVLWAVFGAIAACAVGLLASVAFLIQSNVPSGIAMIGVALVCGGLSIFLFFGCREATKGIMLLTKKMVLGMKKCFVGKERA